MDGFKSLPKMQCFKEGGAVKYKSKHSESKEMEKDIAKDKQIVKKAFKIHDTQSHEGEKTDLSKLRQGGRIKKCGGGNVRKYKAGGSVTGGSDVAKDGGKKTGGADIKTGQKTGGADIKTGKKTGGSDAAKDGGTKSMGLNNAFKKGGKVKKMAEGGVSDEEMDRRPPGKLPQQMVDELAREENRAARKMITDPVKKMRDMLLRKGNEMEAKPLPLKPGYENKNMTPYKKGGKAC